jgi:hypothetical protein
MKRSGMVEGAHVGSGGEVGPLHHAPHGPPPRSGEDFERPHHLTHQKTQVAAPIRPSSMTSA